MDMKEIKDTKRTREEAKRIKEMKVIKLRSPNLGGKRPGSGRPKGSGKYKENTLPIRVPSGLIGHIQELLSQYQDQAKVNRPSNISTVAIREIQTSQTAQETNTKLQEISREHTTMAVTHLTFGENVFRPVIKHNGPTFPLFSSKVAAGFPSPADDYIEAKLDLNQYLVKRPAATFFVRVEGESMIKAGIHPDDILVVDRSVKPTHGKIVIAVLNGELTVKRLKIAGQAITLLPENDRYSPIPITEEMNFTVWGVVTNVIHTV